jgi:hypothetical protein
MKYEPPTSTPDAEPKAKIQTKPNELSSHKQSKKHVLILTEMFRNTNLKIGTNLT